MKILPMTYHNCGVGNVRNLTEIELLTLWVWPPLVRGGNLGENVINCHVCKNILMLLHAPRQPRHFSRLPSGGE